MSAQVFTAPPVAMFYAHCGDCNWVTPAMSKGAAEQASQHHDRDVHGIQLATPSAQSWLDAHEDFDEPALVGQTTANSGGLPGGLVCQPAGPPGL